MKFTLIVLPLFCLNVAFAQQWRIAKGTEGFAAADICIYRSDPDTMYAIGSFINDHSAPGLLISTDGGESWNVGSGQSTDVGAIKVDPLDSKRIYVSVYGRDPESNDVSMTTDGGKSWRRIFTGRSYPAPVIEIDPVDLRTVYVGIGPNSIGRSTDRGETWESLTTPPGVYLNALAIAPSNDSILYAAYVSGVFKSTDKGTSWTTLPLNPGHWGIECVTVDPRNADIVYAAVYSRGLPPGGVFKSTDGGATWDEKNNGLDSTNWQIQSVIINPNRTIELLIGTASIQNRILFQWSNANKTWFLFNNGLPDSGGVGTIVIDTTSNKLLIAVRDWQETGIYAYDLPTAVTNGSTKPEPFSLLQNYPNPFNPVTIIEYKLSAKSYVTLKVYDMLGREVETLVNMVQREGFHQVIFDGSKSASGVYFYKLNSGAFSDVKKMLLIR